MCLVHVCMNDCKQAYLTLMGAVFVLWSYNFPTSPASGFISISTCACMNPYTHTTGLHLSVLCPCCSLCLECLSLISTHLNSSYFQNLLPKAFWKTTTSIKWELHSGKFLHSKLWTYHDLFNDSPVEGLWVISQSRSLSLLAVSPWASQIIFLIPIFSSVKLQQ